MKLQPAKAVIMLRTFIGKIERLRASAVANDDIQQLIKITLPAGLSPAIKNKFLGFLIESFGCEKTEIILKEGSNEVLVKYTSFDRLDRSFQLDKEAWDSYQPPFASSAEIKSVGSDDKKDEKDKDQSQTTQSSAAAIGALLKKNKKPKIPKPAPQVHVAKTQVSSNDEVLSNWFGTECGTIKEIFNALKEDLKKAGFEEAKKEKIEAAAQQITDFIEKLDHRALIYQFRKYNVDLNLMQTKDAELSFLTEEKMSSRARAQESSTKRMASYYVVVLAVCNLCIEKSIFSKVIFSMLISALVLMVTTHLKEILTYDCREQAGKETCLNFLTNQLSDAEYRSKSTPLSLLVDGFKAYRYGQKAAETIVYQHMKQPCLARGTNRFLAWYNPSAYVDNQLAIPAPTTVLGQAENTGLSPRLV